MVWLEMANPSFPPSPWLSLYIKTTYVQPHGLVFFQTFSSVTEFFHQSHLAVLDMHFLHPMQLSYPSVLPGPVLCTLPPTKLIHSSSYPRRMPLTSHTYVSSSAQGRKKKDDSRTKLNPTCSKNKVIAYTRGSLGRKQVAEIASPAIKISERLNDSVSCFLLTL